jgi:regulator of sirC expression with transglutaminase-like and TPR domain
MSRPVRESFAKEVARDDSGMNLAYAALLISEYLTHAADIAAYLAILDELAARAQPAVQAAKTDVDIVEALNQFLFNKLNFAGNSGNYYHPDNSFLNKVLDQRTGIPISLSVIYLEIGLRLGLPLWGIGMPRHFIVGYGTQTRPIYIDVFDQGRILNEDDCLAICHVAPADRLAFKHDYLKPTPNRAIIFRMLLNLKQIYVTWEDWTNAYKTVDLMVLTRPAEITEVRDRGLLAYRLDRLQDAIFDIKRYLFLASDSVDAGWLENRLEAMEERLNRLN